MTNPQQLVQKLWDYCNILRDEGLWYGDYVEQPTLLLFLKRPTSSAGRRMVEIAQADRSPIITCVPARFLMGNAPP
jgi:hypothetical protein